jgi:hypothetical protein
VPHTHVIDGKIVPFDDNTCPYCHPSDAQQTSKEKEEQLPRTYRKTDTIVLKITRGRLVTANYWKEGSVYLMSMQHIVTDINGNAMLDKDRHAIWDKQTVRVPVVVMGEWLMLLSTLHSEVKNQGLIPKRD